MPAMRSIPIHVASSLSGKVQKKIDLIINHPEEESLILIILRTKGIFWKKKNQACTVMNPCLECGLIRSTEEPK
jgi:hypothetical protein